MPRNWRRSNSRTATPKACPAPCSMPPRATPATAGASDLQARMERAISHRGDWPVRPDAARDDVIAFWHQIVSLHRRKRTLSRELKDAEHALGAEPTEAN